VHRHAFGINAGEVLLVRRLLTGAAINFAVSDGDDDDPRGSSRLIVLVGINSRMFALREQT